ncbi:MAG: DUF1003 domain-containing protein [Holophaga sp.]|nr:DUF1003 domain-containing protein [Holophaga sp.]
MTSPNPLAGPAAKYRHDHPPVRNVNEVVAQAMTLGQRVADRVAVCVGSWPFIIVQSILLCLWMGFNVYLAIMMHAHPGFMKAWDPYPFILLNLVLSFQAAYTGPVVMMSQNRQSEKDRVAAQNDYEINKKAEKEIEVILKHLVHQDNLILEATKRIEGLHEAANPEGLSAGIGEMLKRMDQQEQALQSLRSALNLPR